MNDPERFWSWFRSNEVRFRDLEVPHKELLLNELLEKLQEFSGELWFELGGRPDGPRELVITAEGNADSFDDVRCLVRAAPQVPGWEFIAFKPAQGFDFVTEYEGVTVAPEATWFLPLQSSSDPKSFGIRVGYAHYESAKRSVFLAATYIMLEAGLGELATAERIQHVEVGPLPSVPDTSGYVEISRLAEFLSLHPENLDRNI